MQKRRLTTHPLGWSVLKKEQKLTSVGEDVKKLEPLCTVGGIVKWYSIYGKQYVNFSKS
jgi:hypothetical protein